MSAAAAAQAAPVELLDLRGQAAGLPGWVERLIVVDRVATLADHEAVYAELGAHRRRCAVVCVAVGDTPLRPPEVLRYTGGVVLWVGDPDGVRWGPAEDVVRSAAGGPGLDGLLRALRLPDVFDRVRAELRDTPFGTAGPGVELATVAITELQLHIAHREALNRLHGAGERSTAYDGAVVADARRAGARTAGPPMPAVRQTDKQALAAIETLDESAGRLGGPGALLAGRPGRYLGSELADVGRSVADHHVWVHTVLVAIHAGLLGRAGAAEEPAAAGVGDPDPVRHHELAADLRELVGERLAARRAIPPVVDELGRAERLIVPQGCADALVECDALRPRARELPAFARWPIPQAALPLVLISGALGALGPGTAVRWGVAAAVVVAWLLAGWLVLARRPTAGGEYGFGRSAGPALVYGLTAAAGAAAAAWSVPGDGRSWLGWVAVAMAVLILAGTVLLGWRSAARSWAGQLDLDRMRGEVEQAERLLRRAVTEQWLPSARHRAIAEALGGAAAALDEIKRVLPAPRAVREPGDGAARPVEAGFTPPTPELIDVVLGDLVELTRAALDPYWSSVAAGSPASRELSGQQAQEIARGYTEHVATHGIQAAPPFGDSSAIRTALAAQLWRSVPDAAAAVLAAVEEPMVQLCSPDQLDSLSIETRHVRAPIRFAPPGLLLSPGVAEPDIIRTGPAGVAGTIRLMPLRPGQVDPHETAGQRWSSEDGCKPEGGEVLR